MEHCCVESGWCYAGSDCYVECCWCCVESCCVAEASTVATGGHHLWILALGSLVLWILRIDRKRMSFLILA